MMKFCLLMALFLSGGFARAQNASVNILKSTLGKMQALKSISYRENFNSVNPLSKGDTTFGKSQTTLVFDAKGLIEAMAEQTVLNNGQTKYKNIYRADTLFSLDQTDSVYSFNKAKREDVDCDLMSVKGLIGEAIKNPAKIFQKKDTVFNHILCYSFFFKTYDKVEKGNHNYTYNYLLINKKTLMPVYTRENGAGVMEKGGYVIGRVSVFNEKHFTVNRINAGVNSKLFGFNKADFYLKNESMLAYGSPAPAISLKSLNNQTLPASQFKNKLVLIEFGATDCAANPLANPMLNRFSQQYAGKEFTIVTVFTNESAGQLKKYAMANNLTFPMYLGGKQLKQDFRTVATPNFYLISADGKIIKGFDGFSSELEPELTKLIDGELSSK